MIVQTWFIIVAIVYLGFSLLIGYLASRTIKNAILASKNFYTKKINDKITDYLSESPFRSSMPNGNDPELE